MYTKTLLNTLILQSIHKEGKVKTLSLLAINLQNSDGVGGRKLRIGANGKLEKHLAALVCGSK